MPNWCSNTLNVSGSAIQAVSLRALMTTSQGKFDFRAILPMPDEVRCSESSSTAKTAWELKYGQWHNAQHHYGPAHFMSRNAAMEAARAADEWRPMVIATAANPFPQIPPRSFDELADAVQHLVVMYGYTDWHSWARANWGTKWLAENARWMSPARAAQRFSHQVACFATAWEPPLPVIQALSRRFTDVILRLEYSDPDVGLKGFVAFENGAEIAERLETRP